MKSASRVTTIVAVYVLIGIGAVSAETLSTHRIPALLAAEAANEVVAACGRQGYHETAVVLDADGAIIAVLRGDGAGIHTLDSAHDKAYTAVTFRNDTLALAERAKGEELDRAAGETTACNVLRRWCGDQARRRGYWRHRCRWCARSEAR